MRYSQLVHSQLMAVGQGLSSIALVHSHSDNANLEEHKREGWCDRQPRAVLIARFCLDLSFGLKDS